MAEKGKKKNSTEKEVKKILKGKKTREKGLDKKKRIQVLKKFTKEALKKYGPVIRSIVLFGSTARQEFKGESDIDVFVIIDDTKTKISPSMKEKMEDDMERMAKKCNRLLSVQQPYLLTEFWGLVRIGHPIIFNFIREGVPIYDKDIFLPIKRLLQMGEIKPSKEAVEKFIERGPKRIKRVESAKLYMVVEDCYYAMLESAQAVLMFLGKNPPKPSDAPEALRTLTKMKLLEEKYIKYLGDILDVRKNVEHKKTKKISGQELDEWIAKTKKFVKKMQELIVKIEVLKRENMIEKSYSIMVETTLTLLKAFKKMPKKKESIGKAFETHLVKPGIIDKKYLMVLDELEKMRNISKQGKIMELPKQKILMHREYVRKFIREAGKALKSKARNKDQ